MRREFLPHSKCNYALLTYAIKSKVVQTKAGTSEVREKPDLHASLCRRAWLLSQAVCPQQNENCRSLWGSGDPNGTHRQVCMGAGVQDTICSALLVGTHSTASGSDVFISTHLSLFPYCFVSLVYGWEKFINLYHKIYFSNINWKKKKVSNQSCQGHRVFTEQ